MDNATRLHYLEAMGIDVWVARHRPVAADFAVVQPVDAPEPPPPVQMSMEKPVLAESLAWEAQAESYQSQQDHPESGLHSESVFVEVPEALDVDHGESNQHGTLEELNAWLPPSSGLSARKQGDELAWKALKQEVSVCRACGLCETRTQTVFGVGNHHARWMLIGEAPGQNEDLQGEPFVGKAGQLLTEMLRAIGLKREDVFIANMLKCRPPNNRDPQAGEVDACHGFLKRQIELIQPKLIVAVGRIAAQNLLKTQQPLSRLRGIRHELEGVPLTVVHHPAYLLRSLPEKAKAWEDLQFALSVYQSLQL